jgi:hypothetical protein
VSTPRLKGTFLVPIKVEYRILPDGSLKVGALSIPNACDVEEHLNDFPGATPDRHEARRLRWRLRQNLSPIAGEEWLATVKQPK